jgi:hypothetical protein
MTDPSTVAGQASVTATQLAEHLDMTRQRIGVLADVDHVLERLPDGRFDVASNRIRYIRHLRTERARSPNGEATAALAQAKAAMLQIQIEEKKRTLVPMETYEAMIDELAGLTLTALSSPPARCAPRDLATRRAVERVVLEIRAELAAAAQRLANESGEPPPSEQG